MLAIANTIDRKEGIYLVCDRPSNPTVVSHPMLAQASLSAWDVLVSAAGS